MQLTKRDVSNSSKKISEVNAGPKGVDPGGVAAIFIRNVLNTSKRINSAIIRSLSSITIKPYTMLEGAIWKLFNDRKNDRILYKKLIQVFPELSMTKPGVYECFYRVIGTSTPDDCFFEIETKPLMKGKNNKELHTEFIKAEISGTGLKYKAGFIVNHITSKIKVLYITHPTDKMKATRSNLLFVIRGFGVIVSGSGIPERF